MTRKATSRAILAHFTTPRLSIAQRFAAGKALREQFPREAHSWLPPAPYDRDPIAVLKAQAKEIDGGEIRQQAVIGVELADIGELQLLHHIGDPAGAEAFPEEHVNAAFAEQRPHGHFDGARVGSRNDADAVVSGNLENFAGKVDGQLQLFLADLGAVRTTERGIGKRIERPTGTLRAGARRKMRVCRTRGRGDHISHIDTLPGN